MSSKENEPKYLLMFQEPKWKCDCDGKDKNDWIIYISEDKVTVVCNWCGKTVAKPDLSIHKNAIFRMKHSKDEPFDEYNWRLLKRSVHDLLCEADTPQKENEILRKTISFFDEVISNEDMASVLSSIEDDYQERIDEDEETEDDEDEESDEDSEDEKN